MNAFEKSIHMGLIEADLQQAWELIDAGKYDLALHHLEQAAEKIKQMKSVAATQKQLPEPPQPTLEI